MLFRSKLLRGDYYDVHCSLVSELVNFLSILRKIVTDVSYWTTRCIYSFFAPLPKQSGFPQRWFIRTKVFAVDNLSVISMIQAILSSGHPNVSVVNMYTFLWCPWKARNDVLFGRKVSKPSQVYAAMQAILQETSMYQLTMQDC